MGHFINHVPDVYSFENIPFELVDTIAKFCDIEDIINLSLICKYMNIAIKKRWSVITKAILGFNINLKEGRYLFPYQLKAVRWVLDRQKRNLNSGLHIKMGLGKTLMTIVCMYESFNNLVICPKNIIQVWKHEIEKFTNLKYYVYHQDFNDIKKLERLSEKRLNKHFNKYNIIITSYTKVRSGHKLDRLWNTLLIDESHKISNEKTANYCSVMVLKAKHKIAMSGTFIKNGKSDFKSILKFLDVKDVHVNYLNIDYKANVFKLDYDDAGVVLPKINIIDIRKTLGEKHNEIYQRFKKKFDDEYAKFTAKIVNIGNVLAVLTRLRQVCITPYLITMKKDLKTDEFEGPFESMKNKNIIYESPKLVETIRVIKMILDRKEKVMVMSKFSSALTLISEMISDNYFLIDGHSKDRHEKFKKFNKEIMTKKGNRSLNNVDILLANTDIVSMGVNLTGANNIILLEPWWNNATPEQGIARIHRIGQKKECNVYNIIMDETIEIRMLEICNKKDQTACSIHSGGMLAQLV